MDRMFEAVGRRSLVTGLSVGAVALGASLGGEARAADPPTPPTQANWLPAHEAADDWLELPGRHRMVFDAASASGAADAADFAAGYLYANKQGYGLTPQDLAVVIIMRHFATPLAFNDAIWARYGAAMGKVIKLDDPKTKAAPTRNLLLTTDDKDPEAQEATLTALAQSGVRLAVCDMATQRIAQKLAGDDKAKAEALHKELVANLVPGAHMVAAGIVALNRTQERGYAVAHMG
jgi:intracellular sulfur oxidation DsrE/DsrF family protein